MKWIFLLATIAAFTASIAARAHDDDGNVLKHDGSVLKPKAVKDKFVSDDMRKAMGDVSRDVVMVQTIEGRDRIEGKCESKTKDAISVTVPCRGIELTLKSGTKVIEKGELDPRGGFYFDKLSPTLLYTLFVRKKSETNELRFDGMQTGRSYSFELNE